MRSAAAPRDDEHAAPRSPTAELPRLCLVQRICLRRRAERLRERGVRQCRLATGTGDRWRAIAGRGRAAFPVWSGREPLAIGTPACGRLGIVSAAVKEFTMDVRRISRGFGAFALVAAGLAVTV